MQKSIFKSNPYWNTIWSHRDQEFYWSGVKFGFVCGAVMVPMVYFAMRSLSDEFKTLKKDK